MPENSLYWLDQIQPSHRASVGDKAFHLGFLAQRGYSVVPGIVVAAEVFQASLEQIEWTEPMFTDLPNSSLYLDVDNPRQLQAVAQNIRQTLQSAILPDGLLDRLEQYCQQWHSPALILRPSLALPFGLDPTVSLKTTGLLEARVCPVNKDAIAQSLKQVWAELFRARSLLYWQRLHIQLQQIRLAVLVQPMRSVLASGTAQLHDTQLEVRAVWGLGQGLVNGEIMPDYYSVDRQTGTHTDQPGIKTIAYDVSPLLSTPPIGTANRLQGTYQSHLVEFAQSTDPVLTTAQLQSLVQLVEQTATELGTLLELEWILLDHPSDHDASDSEPQFCLTQVIPHLGERFHRPTGSAQNSASVPTASYVGLAAAPGQVAATAWVMPQTAMGSHPARQNVEIPPGCILVAPTITPDWLPWIKNAVGIVTEQGGFTSHGAVLARELRIPAVTGIVDATHLIQTGEKLLVDGDRGEVRRGNAVETQEAPTYPQDRSGTRMPAKPLFTAFDLDPIEAASAQVEELSQTPATQLFVTLSQPNLDPLADLPIDGVGLLRSELMMLELLEQRHPQQWLAQGQKAELTQRIAQRIQQFAQAFYPRPVFYRSSDLRSHEFMHLEGGDGVPELNPALGMRGTLNYQVNPALFEVELAALRQVQQQGGNNVHLILPFVRTVEEFRRCRQRVEQAGLRQNPHFQLWIMAEVPSVLLLLPDYIEAGVQGVSIGSNDLTQLLLGIDREQPQMAFAFDSHHPAVMRAIQQIIQTTRRAQIPCSICGQLTSQYPETINALVRWGVTAISVEWNEIEPTYQAIVRAERRLLLEAARRRLEGGE
ncbi:putative PEP-binding protein [Egbenema bharatensis]|uniref:putative PEP-binding protein n=1 Tax=Egbenema bharatensis TaxID=3463334 RepID=UPI003A84D68F